MGAATIAASFLMCIVFNMILPSGDVYSDVALMTNTLTFKLGDSLELAGCKVCHGITEDELYSKTNSCDVCLTNEYYLCGGYSSILNNITQLQNRKECVNETLRVTNKREFKSDACQKDDYCCLQTFDEQIIQSTSHLDPRLLTTCYSYSERLDFDYCYVTGKANYLYCLHLQKLDPTFFQQLGKLIESDVSYGGKDKIKNKLFTYKKVDNSTTMFSENFTCEDKCGVYMKPKIKNQPLNRRCNEHACQVHLQYLHLQTNILNLQEWKNTTDFQRGVKIGGKSCSLLRIYGATIIIPILLNFLFNVVLFKNDLRVGKANKWEVIPLVLLCYPQYKTVKFLGMFFFSHRDEEILNRDKEENDRVVAPLEPFLESSLQVRFFFQFLIIY